ncbi:MAG: V-type ATP synthase subunit B [Lachnospiraceae bacterium]|nr:V-type ATP synthase subunit B [Lachnospiraceae bacterium]
MAIEYKGITKINGPFVIVEGIADASYDENVEVRLDNGARKLGRVVECYENRAVVQIFEGTTDLSLVNTTLRFSGHPMETPLSGEILGREFNGIGEPIDGLGEIISNYKRNVNGEPLNPCEREYPRNYIHTGISAIDGLTTLIRGQKLPIFSGNGLPHDELAAQIVTQASLGGDANENFAVVFAAMGVKYDVAEFFRKKFRETGANAHVVMYLNLANDPVIERIITPKIALTAAEYLAFEEGMHVLVILTDMTSYAEALREVSSAKGEIPSRKGYPGYLYSEFATIYERAGIVKGCKGSVTQVPILTMPNDDITHPIPDLTGYITEGQIVLERELHQKNIYPPINILPSLSRLMKDGIGEGYTRKDHKDVANQLFSCYAHVGEARSLASVIGEEELSEGDKRYLKFGREFEQKFLCQDKEENRSMEDTLELAWKLLRILPKESLDRIDTKLLDEFY